jgi:hypothetical protein
MGIICCTEPWLIEALYDLYVRSLLCITCTIVIIFYFMTSDLLQQTMTPKKTDPSSHQRGRHTKTRPWMSKSNKYLVINPRLGSTPRLTDWPSVATWLWLWLWVWLGLFSAAESARTRMDHVLGEIWRLHEFRLGQRIRECLKTI